MGALQVSIETIEDTNYGDHGERIRKSHVVVPGETVEALVHRVFPRIDRIYSQHNPGDEIIIRVMVGADGKVTGRSEETEAADDKPPF
jgi:enterochelin esterase-like enzyme